MKLTYLFDPLCGWCYAAAPALRELSKHHEIDVVPTGLFAEQGRTMTESFAQHAWGNDMRIQQLTGQPFTESYRDNVLKVGTPFDSTDITLALIAVKQITPEQVLNVLHALQKMRYVDGRDNTNIDAISEVLRQFGLAQAIALINDEKTIEFANQIVMHGQMMMNNHHIQGVPNMIMHTEQGEQVLPGGLLYDMKKCVDFFQRFDS